MELTRYEVHKAVNTVNKLSQTALSCIGCGGFTVKVGLDGL
jgi:hypothetical protein